MEWIAKGATKKWPQEKLTIAASNNDNAAIKRIQDQIVRRFPARALAVRRILENRGEKTPGVDGVLWEMDSDKMMAIHQLKDLRNDNPKLVQRIDKPGKTEKRPLGIPTLFHSIERYKPSIYWP